MTSRRPTSIATSWAATLLKGGDALAARDRSHFPRHFLPPLASKSCSDYSVIWEEEIRHEGTSKNSTGAPPANQIQVS